jgi:hypothetical protein
VCTDCSASGWVALAVVLLTASVVAADEPSLAVSAPTHAVTVGDRVPVNVQARGEPSWLWGELTVTVTADGPWAVVDGPNEVVGARPPAWQLTLAPLATGELPLPEMQATARLPDGEARPVTVAESATIEVASVLPPEGDVEPAPLRDPIGVHGLPWEWVAPILIVLIPALAIQHWWLRRRRAASTDTVEAALPPLEQLERLARDLDAAVAVEPVETVCDRLAAGFRRYLERRTGEPACEMTSFELRTSARRLGWPEGVQRGVHRVMRLVDGVRFGRRSIAEGEIRQAISTAVETARGLESHLAPPSEQLEAAS